MPRKQTRKARELKSAVYRAGLTMESFAKDLGVTSQHVRLVCSGKRQSPRVEEAINALIAKHLPNGEAAA